MMRSGRAQHIAVGLGGVLPRSVAALQQSGDWQVASLRGLRQLGEVALDELVLTGMTLTGPAPELPRPVSDYAPAAEELSTLGVAGAHAEPEPLRVKELRRQRFGPLGYQRLTFEHDPLLPRALETEHLGGPATAVVHLCRHAGPARPWLVWIHGAGQGGASDLLMSGVHRLHRELGFNIALPVQPGHGVRRGVWPPYPDHDPLTNVAGMMRAISEVRALVRWLEPQSSALAVSGLSLGSAVAALVSHLEQRVDAVAVYTPIRGLNTMIGEHLWRWGPPGERIRQALQSDVVTALTSVIDPLAVEPAARVDRRLIVAAWHDRMALREPALTLHQRWGGQLFWHDGSHVGQLFSAEVRRVTERFLSALDPARRSRS